MDHVGYVRTPRDGQRKSDERLVQGLHTQVADGGTRGPERPHVADRVEPHVGEPVLSVWDVRGAGKRGTARHQAEHHRSEERLIEDRPQRHVVRPSRKLQQQPPVPLLAAHAHEAAHEHSIAHGARHAGLRACVRILGRMFAPLEPVVAIGGIAGQLCQRIAQRRRARGCRRRRRRRPRPQGGG
eukprot:5994450-Prymnesium_polylepis.1